METAMRVEEALERSIVDGGYGEGRSLLELSRGGRLLIVFLRHSGCTFCREALADLRDRRGEIEGSRAGGTGARIVLVHQGTEDSGRAFFARYGLDDVSRVADPDRDLYRAFDLRRGSLGQLFGPKVIARGIAAALRGHGVGKLEGDGFQMPGTFVVEDGRVLAGRAHETAADRPDYVQMACAVGS